ncbi:unnamed protein product [Staurois parvus]|uniref:Uncharacterized protein n=1 Tax=Staurois parvus TaxID=386267 RepID=A0ABN9ALW8_9NEOB|nr:unnamed protein product [Staurois parvus]
MGSLCTHQGQPSAAGGSRQGRPAVSVPGTTSDQQTDSRDAQQLSGHSAADRVQECSVDRLAGSELWGLQSCGASQPGTFSGGQWVLPTLGYCRGPQA